MSIRAVGNRLIQNGRILLRSFRPYRKSNDAVDGLKHRILPKGAPIESSPNTVSRASAVRNVSFHLHARRLFVDTVLKRVTNSLAADLRRRAAKRLLFGDSAPFFALVGVSLASGTGILTKDDELEGVCWEIREAVSKLQWHNDIDPGVDCFSEAEHIGLEHFEIGPAIAKGSSAVVYAARTKSGSPKKGILARSEDDISSFPFAIKMMFNYDAESNATSILRAMYRETVPARWHYTNEEISAWEQSLSNNKLPLPPHPNVVEMHCVFADRVPEIPGSFAMYPDALPPRINPTGYGRNMSLFLVMRRYDCSLQQYVRGKELSIRSATLLLTQLLEAVAHMNRYGIAHRDLKSDNILLNLSEGEAYPRLVVTDFGCCLANRVYGLRLPYNSPDTDKGGNAALMAPEVALAEAGPFSTINYSKSDAWAVGAIAYEIFGQNNPFYSVSRGEKPLVQNTTYKEEQLPPLPDTVPQILSNLVFALLTRNPSKRLSADLAATVCQLFLWAPSAWLRNSCPDVPTTNEILQWILCLTTKVLYEGRQFTKPSVSQSSPSVKQCDTLPLCGASLATCGRRALPEYQLISAFLTRTSLRQIRDALNWIHNK